MIYSVVVESIVGGGAVAVLVAGVAVVRQVYRLTGLVENGLTDKVDHIEERVDALYDHLIDT